MANIRTQFTIPKGMVNHQIFFMIWEGGPTSHRPQAMGGWAHKPQAASRGGWALNAQASYPQVIHRKDI